MSQTTPSETTPSETTPTRTAVRRALVSVYDKTGLLELGQGLAAAGVELGIITDHPVVPVHLLHVQAALAVREGLDPAAALEVDGVVRVLTGGDRTGAAERGRRRTEARAERGVEPAHARGAHSGVDAGEDVEHHPSPGGSGDVGEVGAGELEVGSGLPDGGEVSGGADGGTLECGGGHGSIPAQCAAATRRRVRESR